MQDHHLPDQKYTSQQTTHDINKHVAYNAYNFISLLSYARSSN